MKSRLVNYRPEDCDPSTSTAANLSPSNTASQVPIANAAKLMEPFDVKEREIVEMKLHNKMKMHNNRRSNFQGLSDKKLNLVFFGIPESPTGTNYHSRVQNDYKAILSVVSNGSLNDRLSPVSLRGYIRLSKYNRLNERPRPILVKFNCIKDVSSILGNCAHLATSSGSRVVVKHDLSKEERRLESFFLKGVIV